MEKHAVARLIGAPPGYVGYEQGGYLTEAIRRKPYAVILLDEIEKAHPEVFNLLLQVLDDGRLTDGHGRTVSFSNTVIIMTSNLGSESMAELADRQDWRELKHQLTAAVERHYRPEFINRIDDMVMFEPLERDQLHRVANIQLRELAERMAAHGIDLTFTDAALDLIVAAGFDPLYGARPLRRVIQNRVANPLAQVVLAGQFDSKTRIVVDSSDGELIVGPDSRERSAAA